MSLAISRLWHVDVDDSSNLDCVQVTLHKIIWSVAESHFLKRWSVAISGDASRSIGEADVYPPL